MNSILTRHSCQIVVPDNAQRFNDSRPIQAFPTKYPPKSPFDPFPNNNGVFSFPPPVWRRRPASSRISSPPVDVEELINLFAAKLNFHETHSSAQKRKHSAMSAPWFSGRITTPSSAPHPALLRLSHTSLLASTHATSSPSASNYHLAHDALTPKPRKPAPFPKLKPPTLHCNVPDSILSLSSSDVDSRVSSFGSVLSSQSRSTSTSSSSSIEPSTPPLLPYNKTDTSFAFDFTENDFHIFDDLLSNFPGDTQGVSSLNGGFLAFRKQHHLPSFASDVFSLPPSIYPIQAHS